MQQLFVVNKNTDRNWQRKMYDIKMFKPPILVLRYISKITSQMYFVTSTSSFEKITVLQVEIKKIYSSKVKK